MESFLVIISFIVAVILSEIIHHFYPKVPLAFIQIGIGMLIFLTPIPIHLEFESEVFLIGIIAPLLFVEGNHVSRFKLVKYLKPVILMAMGLVFTTVIGLGYITHMMMPAIPIAARFALAAIVCPTDAVAVQAIAKGKKLPKGLMTILEGESLLNDAAGILSFNIALLALTTGMFSIQGAVSQFFISTLGGILIGLVVGFLFVQLRIQMIVRGFDNDHVFIFIQLLTPFVIYLAAESVHVSGVIAAVIGGIIHGIERDRMSQATTRLQIGYNYTWGLLSTALNGMVFTMLGYIVPEVTMHMIHEQPENIVSLVFYTVIIALLVYLFRFIWVFVLYDMFYIPESRFVKILNNEDPNKVEKRPSRFKYAFLTTICGIHGTISMAIALTLPKELYNHQDFASRDDLLFIAAGVVIISLVVAQLILPFITQPESEGEESRLSFREARIKLMEYGIQYLHDRTTPDNSVVAGNLIRQHTMRVNFFKIIEDEDENPKETARLQAIAMNVEVQTLDRMIAAGEITESMFNNYVQYTERTKLFSAASPLRKLMFFFSLRRRRSHLKNQINESSTLSIRNNLAELEKIARRVHYEVVQKLGNEVTNKNRIEIAVVTDSYLNRVEQLKRNVNNEKIDDYETMMALDLISAERDMVQRFAEKGKISRSVAVELRQSLNYDEMILLGTYEN